MIIYYIIIGIVALLLGSFIGYKISYRPSKRKEIEKEEKYYNQLISDIDNNERVLSNQNAQINENTNILSEIEIEKNKLSIQKNEENNQLKLLQQENSHQQDLLAITKQQIQDIKEEAKKSAETIYESQMALTEERMEKASEKLGQEYQQAEEEYRKEYLQILEEAVERFQLKVEKFKEQIAALNESCGQAQERLDDLTKKSAAAVAANKRAEELKIEKDFYRLIIPKSDLEEISTLKEIVPRLRDKEALYKVIYKVYYEKPYTDLIGRLLDNRKVCGIYKITDIESQRCYVGQSVNIAERWKQHIKRGCGAETPTRNKLYTAMMDIGVENFTFELIEECEPSQLNEREDYWQNFFQAKEFGYSIK